MSYSTTVRGFAPLTLIASAITQPMSDQPKKTLITHTDQRLEVDRWNAISVGAMYAAMTSAMMISPTIASIDTTFHGSEVYGEAKGEG